MSQPRIVFVPGFATDHRVSRVHHDLPYPVSWARWVPVEGSDDFRSYTDRVRQTAPIDGDCILVGISLGGLAALAIARHHVTPRALVLVGSMRSSAGVNPTMRKIVRHIIPRLPSPLVNLDWVPRPILDRSFGLRHEEDRRLLRDMVRRHSPSDIRRLGLLALSVDEPIEVDCPVLSIHGTRDKTLNYFEDEVDLTLHGAGHLITLTHTAEVRQAICRFVETTVFGSATPHRGFQAAEETAS